MAASEELRIEAIDPKSKSQLKRFIKMHYDVYRNDKNWVAPLIVDYLERLNPDKNPYYQHSEGRLFLAIRDGRPVGRISAHENTMHVEYQKEPVGFFGFFECVDDQRVADALFGAASDWLKSRGLKTLRGPASHSVNGDPIGLLVDGFDRPPVLLMAYNPRYYENLVVGAGFETAQDIYAYLGPVTGKAPGVVEKLAERALRDPRLNIRKASMKEYDAEFNKLKFLYSEALKDNWGAVPMTEEEFDHFQKEMKLAIDPDVTLIAEYDGEPIGLSLVFSDMNVALKGARGRLLPFGILNILLKKNRITMCRVPVLGVLKEYRNRGIDIALYHLSYAAAYKKGYREGEVSFILASNTVMVSIAKHLGMARYKTYRMYDRPIA